MQGDSDFVVVVDGEEYSYTSFMTGVCWFEVQLGKYVKDWILLGYVVLHTSVLQTVLMSTCFLSSVAGVSRSLSVYGFPFNLNHPGLAVKLSNFLYGVLGV